MPSAAIGNAKPKATWVRGGLVIITVCRHCRRLVGSHRSCGRGRDSGNILWSILDSRRDEFKRRRDFLLPELQQLGFTLPHTPAGALYLYAGIERFGQSSAAFCHSMLEEHGISVTPGADFGRYRADEHVRFAYTTSMERLEEAVSRLRRLFA